MKRRMEFFNRILSDHAGAYTVKNHWLAETHFCPVGTKSELSRHSSVETEVLLSSLVVLNQFPLNLLKRLNWN